jgi:thymidylate kinase
MRPMTQMLMYTAARVELAHYFLPWINDGGHVIIDRWWPSTFAYQGAGGVDRQLIRGLSMSLVPEECRTTRGLTFFIDVPIPVAMERSGTLVRGGDPETGGDRFEQKGVEFQQDLLNLYSLLCSLGEMTHVNACNFKSAEETAQYLWDHHVKGFV